MKGNLVIAKVYGLSSAGERPLRLGSTGGLSDGPPVTVLESAAAGVNVSILTPLFAFTALRDTCKALLFSAQNLGTDPATVTLENSEFGTVVDATTTVILAIPAGGEVAYEVPLVLRNYWRASAQTTTPFPTTKLRWRLSAIPR